MNTDVIISAPHEDSGTLYVYNGRKEGIQGNVYQKINGKDASSGMLSFGSSLSAVRSLSQYGYPGT